MQIEVIIEIPKGTRNKYEADEDGGIWLDRMLFTSTRYPEDYGFVPETLAEDNDPLDAKVLCVPATDPRMAQVNELTDIAAHELAEIAHFFQIYKELEPGKGTEPGGWQPREVAEQVIAATRVAYSQRGTTTQR